MSTAPLRALRKLQFLDISQNDLSDLEETVETVAVWKELREIKCDKNPIAKHRFYEAAIVQCNPLLSMPQRTLQKGPVPMCNLECTYVGSLKPVF